MILSIHYVYYFPKTLIKIRTIIDIVQNVDIYQHYILYIMIINVLHRYY